ncbi:hypothetical protein SASPL_135374 [Salvia splendens]|uniref:Serine/threonine-protein kinase PBS1 n=1 Tax=Salvia splendens TaxID=180675 RepID=A0A8X8ZFQ3_SALSN|nr:hypothetical protein SASPL_135374 [Salvia splendens]
MVLEVKDKGTNRGGLASVTRLGCWICGPFTFGLSYLRAAKRYTEKKKGAFPPSIPHQNPSPQSHRNSSSQQPSNENPRKTAAEATINKTITSREGGEKNNIAGDSNNIAAQTFTFRELAAATKNFRQEYLLGEGGFGRVYKGRLDKTDQLVAVKQLDRNGLQGNREFLVEAEPIFMEPGRFSELADPLLRGEFPKKSFKQAVAISAMCLQEDATVRPLISDVVTALSCLPLQGDAGYSCSVSPHLTDEITSKERDRAVSEAIAWGSKSTHN